MADELRLWLTAAILGVWVAIIRAANETAPTTSWRQILVVFGLSLTSTVFAVLYKWEDYAKPHPQMLLLFGGLAGMCGPELQRLLRFAGRQLPSIIDFAIRLWEDIRKDGRNDR